MHINTPKNATQLVARLSTNEKIEIGRASDARLEHMRTNQLAADGPVSFPTMLEVKKMVLRGFINEAQEAIATSCR